MIQNLKILCTQKQIIYLVLLLFGSLLMAALELLSLGSVPIFASALIGENLSNKIPFIQNLNFMGFGDNNLIIIGSLLVGFLFLIKNIFFGLIIFFENKVIKIIRTDLGVKLFRFYLENDYSFHLKTNPAYLLRNVEGEVSQTTTVLLRFLKLFREVTILLTIFGLLIFTNPKVTLILFISLFFFLAIFFFTTKKIVENNGKKMQLIRAKKIQHINQSFSSIKDIKIMNKENYISQITHENIEGFENPFLINTTINSLPKLFIETLIVLGVVIFTLVLLSLGKTFISALPLISLITVAAIRLFPSFTTISQSLIAIKTYRPSYKLVIEELLKYKKKKIITKDKDNEFKAQELKFSKSLKFEDLEYYYNNSQEKILKKINLEIFQGSKIGIIGRSGSGKSTLINLISGLLKPTSGSIKIDGLDIFNNLRQWQTMISYIPQDIYLIDDTIKKNIAFGIDVKDIDNSKLDQAVLKSNLKEFILNLPDKINTIVGDRGARISGGQKQRIGIARALYDIKDVIIIDEGTNSLDIENEKNVVENIFSIGKNKTIIMISHNHETLKNCDEIIIIDNGKILDKGNYNDLKNKYDFKNFINEK